MRLPTRRAPYLTCLAVLVLAVAGAGVYLAHRPHLQTHPANIKHVVSYSTPTPSEASVTPAAYHWQGGPNDPKYLKLPSIAAEGFIQNMGIDQNNAIAAPSNINLAGWYVNSDRPGDAGLSIIDGHVDGLHAPGIFYKLSTLKAGDTFTIELGSGTIYQFKVKTLTAVSDDQAVSTLFARDNSIQSQLNLITCGGPYDRQAHAYTKRVIVVSEKL